MKITKLILLFIILTLSNYSYGEDSPVHAEIRQQLLQATYAKNYEDAKIILDSVAEEISQKISTSKDPELSLLSAELAFTRGKIIAGLWINNLNTEPWLQTQAKQQLLLARNYYNQILLQNAEIIQNAINKFGKEKAYENPQINKTITDSTKATFSLAWTNYYLCAIESDETKKLKYSEDAQKDFSNFTKNGYNNNEVIANSILGQTLILIEQNKYHEALSTLDINTITPYTTEPEFYKKVTILRVKILKQLQSFLTLEDILKQYFDYKNNKSSFDISELNLAIERINNLADIASMSDINPYAQTHLQRLETFSKELYLYGSPWTEKVEQLIANTNIDTSFASLCKARTYFKNSDFPNAYEKSNLSINLAEPETNKQLIADALYIKTISLGKMGILKDLFNSTIEFIQKFPSDPRAQKISLMTIGIISKRIPGENSQMQENANQVLNFIENNLSDSPVKAKMQWYKANIDIKAGNYEQAEKTLSKITDPNLIQYAILGHADLYLQKIKLAKSQQQIIITQNLIIENLDKLENVIKLEKLDDSDKTISGSIELSIEAARDILQRETPFCENAQLIISRISNFDPEYLKGQNLLSTQIMINASMQDFQNTDTLMGQALLAGISDIEIFRAYVYTANIFENKITNKLPEEVDPLTAKRLTKIYSFLLDYSSKTENPQIIEQQALIHKKMADALLYSRRSGEALKEYHNVLKNEVWKKDLSTVYGYASCYYNIKDYKSSTVYWQTIAKSTNIENKYWFPANYKWIRSLYLTGEKLKAQKLYKYFMFQFEDKLTNEQKIQLEQLLMEISNE